MAEGKRKTVVTAFEVTIDDEVQKRVRGLQLSDDTKRKFVMGFDAGERISEWQQTVEKQAPIFATDEGTWSENDS